MNYIIKNLLEKELVCDGEIILKYHIEYPSIESNSSENINFNYYNKNLALELQNKK